MSVKLLHFLVWNTSRLVLSYKNMGVTHKKVHAISRGIYPLSVIAPLNLAVAFLLLLFHIVMFLFIYLIFSLDRNNSILDCIFGGYACKPRYCHCSSLRVCIPVASISSIWSFVLHWQCEYKYKSSSNVLRDFQPQFYLISGKLDEIFSMKFSSLSYSLSGWCKGLIIGHCTGLLLNRSGFETWMGHCVVFLWKTL